MRAAVIYESMYTNTHKVAEQIADGLRTGLETDLMPVPDGDAALDGIELLVVGGPTHVHGLSRRSTRRAALDAAQKDGSLTVDPAAKGPGVRDWLSSLAMVDIYAASFDTRMTGPAWLTGRASKKIAKRVHQTGCTIVMPPESFVVNKQNELEPGELDRARRWGQRLAETVTAMPRVTPYRSTGRSLSNVDTGDAGEG